MCNLNLKPKLNIKDAFEYVQDRKGHDLRYAIDKTKLDRHFPKLKWTDFDNALIKTINFYLKEANRKLK